MSSIPKNIYYNPKVMINDGSHGNLRYRLTTFIQEVHNLTTSQIQSLFEETSYHGGDWKDALGLSQYKDLLPSNMPRLTSSKGSEAFKETLNTKALALLEMSDRLSKDPELLKKIIEFRSLPPEKVQSEKEITTINKYIGSLTNQALSKDGVRNILTNLRELSQINSDDESVETISTELNGLILKPLNAMSNEQKTTNFFIIEYLLEKAMPYLEKLNVEDKSVSYENLRGLIVEGEQIFPDEGDLDAHKIFGQEMPKISQLEFDLIETFILQLDLSNKDSIHQHILGLCRHMDSNDANTNDKYIKIQDILSLNHKIGRKIPKIDFC